MLKKRLLTIAVLVPVLLAALFLAPVWVLCAGLGALSLLALWEWAKLSTPSRRHRWALVVVVAVLAVALLFVRGPAFIYVSLVVLTVLWWGMVITWLLKYPKSMPYWFRSVIGVISIVMAWIACVYMLQSIRYTFIDGRFLLAACLFTVWANDSWAYIVGKAIGKHKLASKISPGKTIEGFVGGLVFACVFTLLISYPLAKYGAEHIGQPFKFDSLKLWVVLAIIMGCIATIGDLVVSMLKRAAGEKDTGKILPGHGGMLDRVDGLIAALPFYLPVLLLLKRWL